MSNLRKIIVWFLICAILAIYAKSAGLTPGQIGSKTTSSVLGKQTTK